MDLIQYGSEITASGIYNVCLDVNESTIPDSSEILDIDTDIFKKLKVTEEFSSRWGKPLLNALLKLLEVKGFDVDWDWLLAASKSRRVYDKYKNISSNQENALRVDFKYLASMVGLKGLVGTMVKKKPSTACLSLLKYFNKEGTPVINPEIDYNYSLKRMDEYFKLRKKWLARTHLGAGLGSNIIKTENLKTSSEMILARMKKADKLKGGNGSIFVEAKSKPDLSCKIDISSEVKDVKYERPYLDALLRPLIPKREIKKDLIEKSKNAVKKKMADIEVEMKSNKRTDEACLNILKIAKTNKYRKVRKKLIMLDDNSDRILLRNKYSLLENMCEELERMSPSEPVKDKSTPKDGPKLDRLSKPVVDLVDDFMSGMRPSKRQLRIRKNFIMWAHGLRHERFPTKLKELYYKNVKPIVCTFLDPVESLDRYMKNAVFEITGAKKRAKYYRNNGNVESKKCFSGVKRGTCTDQYQMNKNFCEKKCKKGCPDYYEVKCYEDQMDLIVKTIKEKSRLKELKLKQEEEASLKMKIEEDLAKGEELKKSIALKRKETKEKLILKRNTPEAIKKRRMKKLNDDILELRKSVFKEEVKSYVKPDCLNKDYTFFGDLGEDLKEDDSLTDEDFIGFHFEFWKGNLEEDIKARHPLLKLDQI